MQPRCDDLGFGHHRGEMHHPGGLVYRNFRDEHRHRSSIDRAAPYPAGGRTSNAGNKKVLPPCRLHHWVRVSPSPCCTRTPPAVDDSNRTVVTVVLHLATPVPFLVALDTTHDLAWPQL